jgi:hypothetical protein
LLFDKITPEIRESEELYLQGQYECQS